MKYYFAPMEGVTGYIFRNAHHAFFAGADQYFTPFIAPNQHHGLSPKERRDVLPDNNRGIPIVPQILTNSAGDFIRAAKELEELGYRYVNLNLGCPSGTVAAKKRGAGFLAFPDELDRFLDRVFSELDMQISIKTRIGRDSPEEFPDLMEIYNRYPLKELIIHPRTQKDYYNNKPDWEAFAGALASSRCPVCYNGDIFSREDFGAFSERFPQAGAVMLGRGLVANPGLIQWIREGRFVELQVFREFHGQIYEGYREVMSGEKPVLFKMKELWSYFGFLFPDAQSALKKIRKAGKLADYESAVSCLLSSAPIREGAGFRR